MSTRVHRSSFNRVSSRAVAHPPQILAPAAFIDSPVRRVRHKATEGNSNRRIPCVVAALRGVVSNGTDLLRRVHPDVSVGCASEGCSIQVWDARRIWRFSARGRWRGFARGWPRGGGRVKHRPNIDAQVSIEDTNIVFLPPIFGTWGVGSGGCERSWPRWTRLVCRPPEDKISSAYLWTHADRRLEVLDVLLSRSTIVLRLGLGFRRQGLGLAWISLKSSASTTTC